jgi:hypothetical protein
MKITRSSLATGKGPADWFTGDVYIDAAAEPIEPYRLAAASVHFTPGAGLCGTRTPSGRRFLCWRASVAVSAEVAQSRRFGLATACSSSPVRTTGTAPRPTG